MIQQEVAAMNLNNYLSETENTTNDYTQPLAPFFSNDSQELQSNDSFSNTIPTDCFNADPNETKYAGLSTSETSSIENISSVDLAQLEKINGAYALPLPSQSTNSSTTLLGTSGSAHNYAEAEYTEDTTQPVVSQEFNLAALSPQHQKDYLNFCPLNSLVPASSLSQSFNQDYQHDMDIVSVYCNDNKQAPLNSIENTKTNYHVSRDRSLHSNNQSSSTLFKCNPKLLESKQPNGNESASKQISSSDSVLQSSDDSGPLPSQCTTSSAAHLSTSGSAHTCTGVEYNKDTTQPISISGSAHTYTGAEYNKDTTQLVGSQEFNLAALSPQHQRDYLNFCSLNNPVHVSSLSQSFIKDFPHDMDIVNNYLNNQEHTPINSLENISGNCNINTDIDLQSNAPSSTTVSKWTTKLLESKPLNGDEFAPKQVSNDNSLESVSQAICVDASAVGEDIDVICCYCCDFCHENYETREGVILHLENVHRIQSSTSLENIQYSQWLKCKQCNAKYFHRKNMILHLEDKHSTPQCNYCNAHGIFISKDCKDHYKETHVSQYFRCNTCVYKSLNIKIIRKHAREYETCNRGYSSIYVCDICDKNFYNNDSCKSHGQSCTLQSFSCNTEGIKKSLNSTETDYSQQQIVKSCSSQESSFLQTLSQNDSTLTVSCLSGIKSFIHRISISPLHSQANIHISILSLNALTVGSSEASQWVVPTYSCNLCGISRNTFHKLRIHIEEMHIESYHGFLNETFYRRTYECVQCAQHFNTYHLINHLIDDHSVVICKYCNSLFHSSKEYDDHLEALRKTVKFSCNECDKIMITATSIRNHIYAQHKEENKISGMKLYTTLFSCNICNSNHNLKYNLDTIVSHLIDMHSCVVCELCDKIFSSKNEYDHHMSVSYKCQISVQQVWNGYYYG